MIDAFLAKPMAAERDSALQADPSTLRQAMPFPETTPAFSRLAVDDQDNVWVRSYPMHPDSNPDWYVLSADGRLLGGVRLPVGFEEKVIEDDRIIGLFKDELGLEHCVCTIYIVKPGSATTQRRYISRLAGPSAAD